MYSNPSEGHTISIHALREEGDSRPNCRKPALSRFLSTPSARRATTTFNYPRIIEKFLSTPSARRATESAILVDLLVQFLSTPSARRATRSGRCLRGSWSYFYPRPPRGGRPATSLQVYSSPIFLSTPSARRATSRQSSCCWCSSYFYPRPPRGGRLTAQGAAWSGRNFYPRPPRGGRPQHLHIHPPRSRISIHALREEGDALSRFWTTRSRYFYPRPPRGGRLTRISAKVKSVRFLSTPSARRATCASRNAVQLILISIHALREEGDVARALNKVGGSSISIHALREEGDVTRALLPS